MGAFDGMKIYRQYGKCPCKAFVCLSEQPIEWYELDEGVSIRVEHIADICEDGTVRFVIEANKADVASVDFVDGAPSYGDCAEECAGLGHPVRRRRPR